MGCWRYQRVSSVRVVRPVLARMLRTWLSTVRSDNTSVRAISRLDSAWATSPATSRSRGVSGLERAPRRRRGTHPRPAAARACPDGGVRRGRTSEFRHPGPVPYALGTSQSQPSPCQIGSRAQHGINPQSSKRGTAAACSPQPRSSSPRMPATEPAEHRSRSESGRLPELRADHVTQNAAADRILQAGSECGQVEQRSGQQVTPHRGDDADQRLVEHPGLIAPPSQEENGCEPACASWAACRGR